MPRKSTPTTKPGPKRSRKPAAPKAKAPRAPRRRAAHSYLLRLYVTGSTPASQRAIERVRTFCELHVAGLYQLEVIDIYQLPALAKDEQIIATPTLIQVLPAPLRRYLGDLSKIDRVLFGMDLKEGSA